MKKYIFNLLLLALLFCVTACSDDDLGPSIFDTTTEAGSLDAEKFCGTL